MAFILSASKFLSSYFSMDLILVFEQVFTIIFRNFSFYTKSDFEFFFEDFFRLNGFG